MCYHTIIKEVTVRLFKKTCLALAVAAALQAAFIQAGCAGTAVPTVTAQPNVGSDVRSYFIKPTASRKLSQKQIQALLREKIKYVFVIFNENHSFDNEFGTFPGVNGIYSDGVNPRSAQNTPGFFQNYTGADGSPVQVTPFRIGPDQNSTVVDSVDHSHTGLAIKMDISNGQPTMNKYAYREYMRFASLGGAANIAKGTQFARLVMSHIDGDTIPFFW
jgi:phospholipase C